MTFQKMSNGESDEKLGLCFSGKCKRHFWFFDRRGNHAGLLILLWIFIYGRLFD